MTEPLNKLPAQPTITSGDDAQMARDAALYREMVAQVDVSRAPFNEEQRQYIGQAVTRELSTAMGEYADSGLSSDAIQAVGTLRGLVTDRITTANRAAVEIRKALENDRVPMPARVADADRIIAETERTLRDQEPVFDAMYRGAEYALMDAARPVVSSGEETTARADARMLLDGATKPFDVQSRIVQYVSNHDDSVAGLLADEKWLTTYLTGRGLDKALPEIMPGIRSAIAEASKGSKNTARKSAAHRLSVLHHHRAAFDGASGVARYIDPRGKNR